MSHAVQMGIYRHYKGPLYQVLGLAHDANEDGRTCVVYISLQLDGAHLGPRLAVRTLADFTSWINPLNTEERVRPSTPDTGAGETARLHVRLRREGLLPRFQYLGPELTAEMLPVPSGS